MTPRRGNELKTSRAATLVVAAADSSEQMKAAADYVCDGVKATGGDEVEINSAVAALPAAGGKVVLAEGVFWRTAPIVCDRSNVVIEGQGFGSTVASPADNATGKANIIVGSTSASTWVQNSEINDLYIADGSGSSTTSPFTGSVHGLILRGNNCRIRNVRTTHQAKDGIRVEGWKTYGTASTLSGAISTTPGQASQETWNVAASASFTAGGYAQVGVISDFTGDTDPELLYVVSKPNGTSIVVQRGYGGSTIKTHATGAAITPFTALNTFDCQVTDVYVIFPTRTGVYIDPWVTDNEYVGVKVDGGDDISHKLTVTGFYNTGAGSSFVSCHPYFCAGAGFHGNGAGLNAQCTQHIIGGNYESDGTEGILLEWCRNSAIDNPTLYQNAGHNVRLMNCTAVRVSGQSAANTLLTNKQIYVYAGVNIHIDGYTATDNTSSDQIIQFDGVTTKSRITNCGLSVGSDVSWARMINLGNSTYCTVSGNVIEGSIWEGTGANFNSIRGNVLPPISPPPTNNEQPTVHIVGASSVWD